MKSEKGITLIILTIYIIIFSIVIILLANLSSYIYSNLKNINDRSVDVSEINKFNMYFIEDVKTNSQAEIRTLTDSNTMQIVFQDGDIYSYVINEKSIYKNEQKIARNIEAFNAEGYIIDAKKYIQVSIEIGTDDETNYTKASKLHFLTLQRLLGVV